MNENNISIDPGLNGTGYAIWDKKWNLLDNGVIIFSDRYELETRINLYSSAVRNLVLKNHCKFLYIEYPAFFNTVKGSVTASGGGLVKLSVLIGAICGRSRILYEFVPVVKWKGQLPKKVVENRIKGILPKVNAKSHDWDAIGIGLYKKGVF